MPESRREVRAMLSQLSGRKNPLAVHIALSSVAIVTTPALLATAVGVAYGRAAEPLESWTEVKVPQATQVLHSVAWSPDGRLLAAAGESPPIFVWDVPGLRLVRRLDGGAKGMAGQARGIAFSADGKLIAAGVRAVRIWDTATWAQTRELIGSDVDTGTPQPIGVQSLLFSADGESLFVSYNELAPRKSPIVAFSLSDGAVRWTYELQSPLDHPRIIPPLLSLPAHHEIAFASGQGNFGGRTDLVRSTAIIFLDAVTGTETRRIERIHSEVPAAVAISRDEKLIATATRFGSTSNGVRDTDPIRIWDVASGKKLHEIPITASVAALAFTPDSRYLIASQTDSPGHNQLTVWRVESWTPVQTFHLPSAQMVWGLESSPDGRELAAVGPYAISLFKNRDAAGVGP
jgi:WD40 repeat protein